MVNQSGTLIEGTDPGLQVGYTLAAGSPAIDRGASAPSNLASRWIEYQYQPSASYVTRTTLGAANDLGAFERQ